MKCVLLRWLLAVLLISPGAHAGTLVIGQSFTTRSAVLSEVREYRVALPVSYAQSPDRRYPLLVVLDGERHFEHTAASAAYLASDGQIPEMIVVGLTSTNRIRDFTQTDWSQHWVGGGRAADFQRFLASELLPLLEHRYRVDADMRVLSGSSAAGQFGLYCLTTVPQLFRSIIVISPSLDWDDRLPVRSLDAAVKSGSSYRNFAYVASSDDSGDALADVVALAKVMEQGAPRGLRSVYRPFPTETHTGIVLLAQIDGLRQAFAGYALPEDVEDKGLSAVEAYYRQVSQTLDWTVPVPAAVINSLAYDALQADRIEEAIGLFQRNLRDQPSSPPAQDGMTDAYLKQHRFADAAKSARRALALAHRFEPGNVAYYEQQVARVRRLSTPG